jgi:hypothetical protein
VNDFLSINANENNTKYQIVMIASVIFLLVTEYVSYLEALKCNAVFSMGWHLGYFLEIIWSPYAFVIRYGSAGDALLMLDRIFRILARSWLSLAGTLTSPPHVLSSPIYLDLSCGWGRIATQQLKYLQRSLDACYQYHYSLLPRQNTNPKWISFLECDSF